MITINCKLFLKLFKHLVGLTADDPKFELECVHFRFTTDSTCEIASSDGHGLAKVTLHTAYPSPEDQVFLIHKKWLQQILKDFKGNDCDVNIYVMGDKLVFTDGVGSQELEGRQVGEYPDIHKVIKNTGGEDGHGSYYGAELFKKMTAFIFDLGPFEKGAAHIPALKNGVFNVVTQGPGVPMLINAVPKDSVVKSAVFAIMPVKDGGGE